METEDPFKKQKPYPELARESVRFHALLDSLADVIAASDGTEAALTQLYLTSRKMSALCEARLEKLRMLRDEPDL